MRLNVLTELNGGFKIVINNTLAFVTDIRLDMTEPDFNFTEEQRYKLARLVRDLRGDMSYEDFSIKSGITPATIQNLEFALYPEKKGKRIQNFSIVILSKVAYLWDKRPIEYLLAWLYGRDVSPEGLTQYSTEHLLRVNELINQELKKRLLRSPNPNQQELNFDQN